MLTKPEISECPEYYFQYINLVEHENVINLLERQPGEVQSLFGGMTNEDALFKYAAGKWSIKEIIGHLIDAERILGNRGFRFARHDKIDIPQYDHNKYVEAGNFDAMKLDDLLLQFEAERKATVLMFKSFNDENWLSKGKSDGKSFTARCFPFIIAGHVEHHISVIKSKYINLKK